MNRLRFGLVVALGLAVCTFSTQAQEKQDKAEKQDKGEKQEKVGETPYYPLAIGNTWHYKLGDMSFTMRVAKHELVDKAMCARVELIVDNKIKAFEHIGVKSDGVYRYSYDGKKTEPPACILKLPPKAGETWEINAKVGGETLKGNLKEAMEDIKVPAGSFKTVTVAADDFDANNTRISFKYYFAEKTGMVKQDLNVN